MAELRVVYLICHKYACSRDLAIKSITQQIDWDQAIA